MLILQFDDDTQTIALDRAHAEEIHRTSDQSELPALIWPIINGGPGKQFRFDANQKSWIEDNRIGMFNFRVPG